MAGSRALPPELRRIQGGAGPRIGLMDRLHPAKGQMEFVEAAELASDWPDAEFVSGGDALSGDPLLERYKRAVLAAAVEQVRHPCEVHQKRLSRSTL